MGKRVTLHLGPKDARELALHLRSYTHSNASEPWMHVVLERLAKAATQGAQLQRAARRRKVAKAHSKGFSNAQTRAIYEAVRARAGGKCEACAKLLVFGDIRWGPEMDHFIPRSHGQAAASCWLLHRACHQAKTGNNPNARYWLERFAAHCDKHGYGLEAEWCRARLGGIVRVREASKAEAVPG